MSRIIGSHGPLPFFILLLVCAFLIPAASGFAQSKEEMMTLDQYKAFLRDEGKGRDLSQATHEELTKILPGGSMSEKVVKIGISTFILNLTAIYLVAIIAITVILLFFTPFGLFVFRGSLHAMVGAVLKASGLSKRFGEHLMTEPKKWLRLKNGRVREAFGTYMHNDFIPQYKNNITAIAFLGTAFLIGNIGLRGVKFMVAHQPDLIIIAILVEITVLCLLGLTTWYEKEEDDETGTAPGQPGKQLTLVDVERRLDALKKELEESVSTEAHLRGGSH